MSADEGVLQRELIKGVRRGNNVTVKRILLLDEDVGEGLRLLSVQACFMALEHAVKSNHLDIGHLLLDHAEKCFHQDDIRETIWRRRILDKATVQNMVSLVKRLIGIVDVMRYNADRYFCPLRKAAKQGHLGLVKAFLAAGFNANKVLNFYDDYDEEVEEEYHDHDESAGFSWDLLFINPMDEEDKKVWKLILPRVDVSQVFTSDILGSACSQMKGGDVLHILEQLGMDFKPFIAYSDQRVRASLCRVMKHHDAGAVQFFVDHGFDVNIGVNGNSNTAVHYLLSKMRPGDTDSLLSLIKAGACLELKNDDGCNAEELCINKMKGASKLRVQAYGKSLSLFHRIGYQLTEKSQSFIHSRCHTDAYSDLIDLSKEITQVPSLQCLCGHVIRAEKKSEVRDCLENMGVEELPMHLKDFILLKYFTWDPLPKLTLDQLLEMDQEDFRNGGMNEQDEDNEWMDVI